MSDELLAFLSIQLADDERAARYAIEYSGAHWSCPSTGVVDLGVDDGDLGDLICTGNGPVAHFIVDNDPARVLREVAAKRRIIEWCDRATRVVSADDYEMDVRTPLELLASVYSDRPGYRPEWAI